MSDNKTQCDPIEQLRDLVEAYGNPNDHEALDELSELRSQLAECQWERDEANQQCIEVGKNAIREAKRAESAEQQLQQMKEALVLCMEPLEAIRMSVKWELCDSIKQAVVNATESGRRALLSGKGE